MSESTLVYLITGFLGAGKTTFLNRVIDRFPKDKKLTLLVNEFGEVGVDGALVEGDDIDMMEISKGSIFCVCVKTDFIKGLYELGSTVKPDVLLIESTGVANPSDLKRDLQLPIFDDRFQFKEQFCIIDAAHFLDAYEVYASLEKQIASSSVFIINKIDAATHERIEETKAVVRQFHTNPTFYETTFSDIPLDAFFAMEEKDGDAKDAASEKEEEKKPVLTSEELEQFIDDLLDSPDLQLTPPDLLVSAACQWTGDNLDEVRTMAANLPAPVVRAKGFVEEKGVLNLFNYVMGDWTVAVSDVPEERVQNKNVVVFIGPPDSMEGVQNATRSGNWIHLGEHQAYTA